MPFGGNGAQNDRLCALCLGKVILSRTGRVPPSAAGPGQLPVTGPCYGLGQLRMPVWLP